MALARGRFLLFDFENTCAHHPQFLAMSKHFSFVGNLSNDCSDCAGIRFLYSELMCEVDSAKEM